MTPVLLLAGYAVAVACYLPAALTRLTARGVSPRLGLAAWLAAMLTALAAMAAAVVFLVRAAARGWPWLAEAVCREVAGRACARGTYQNAIFELALAAAAIIVALAAAVAAWRYGRSLQRAQRQTRAHARTARIAGRALPGAGPAVVLDAPQRAAYCVPGRPAAIVVTTAALAVLDQAQLAAVLAHERAHLAGRHHLLVAVTRALAVSFPAVPLFTAGPRQVARLAEMCADDSAARGAGRPALVAALLAMGTGLPLQAAALPLPATALAATGCAVTARVQRLLSPPGWATRARCRLALGAAIIALVVASALVAALAAATAGPAV
jgi:Zn-dependent protease with chaperone function